MSKERALIYPYDRECSPIIRHKNLLNNYEIIAAVSPNGWGFVGEDAGCIDGGNPVNIIIDSEIDNTLDKCETVIFADASSKLNFDNIIYPKIIHAVKEGKNIACLTDFGAVRRNLIQKLCNINGVLFKPYHLDKDKWNDDYSSLLAIQKIETPVIFVLGISEETNKFEIQLSLRDQLIKMGYKVSQIGTRGYCELFNFHSFPGFMYSKSIREMDKIKLFNNYVKNIEMNEKPDVILIGIPGAIMKLSDIAVNDFGVLAFEVSQAIKPDAAFLSIVYEEYTPEFFYKISKEIEYKFGFNIDGYNIANKKVDWNLLKQEKRLNFINIGPDEVNKKINELKASEFLLFNILENNEGIRMTNYLVDSLAYDDYEII